MAQTKKESGFERFSRVFDTHWRWPFQYFLSFLAFIYLPPSIAFPAAFLILTSGKTPISSGIAAILRDIFLGNKS